ncbi:MAG: hypothetical protein NTU41_13325, partial [Chloroflexi bacterium]|nr:hypothetical protein [Chloroflexota bacterium]
MRLVRRSLAVILLGVVCYALGVASQVGWLYLFAACAWSMGAISVLAAWLGLRRVELSRVLLAHNGKPQTPASPAEVSEGDELEVGIVVTNNSRWPKYLLKVTETCPLEGILTREKAFLVTSLGARQSANIRYKAKCDQRGEFHFPHVIVEAGGPFGIISRHRKFPSPLEVLVYPECYRLSALPITGCLVGANGWRARTRA